MLSPVLFLLFASLPGDPSVGGAVARRTTVDTALTRGLTLHRQLVKIATPEGHYRCALEVEGYALRDILDRVGIKKVDDGFNLPLDTFISVKGRTGASALFSYSETFLAGDSGPLLASRTRLLLPHHHEPLQANNDPTILRTAAERAALDLHACASCHAASAAPALSLPQGWLLISPSDGFGGRFVEDVTEVSVGQTGLIVKDTRDSTKAAFVDVPKVVAPDGAVSPLTPERYQAVPQRAWKDAAIGMGMGFRGEHEWRGAELGLLLRPLLPASADPRQLWILVTAEDGYRVLLSGSEVFAAPDGRGVFLADWRDGKPLGPGSVRYHVVPRPDFFTDCEVRMVKEIRIGQPGAPR